MEWIERFSKRFRHWYSTQNSWPKGKTKLPPNRYSLISISRKWALIFFLNARKTTVLANF